MPDDSIQVVLLGRGYFLETTKKGGQKGQKIYMEASFHPDPGTPVSLPSIDDPWSTDAPSVKVVNIFMEYLNQDTNCGRTWTVSYQNDITENDETVINPDEEDLQTTIELGAELISFQPPADVWHWYAGGPAITIPIGIHINTAVVKVYRTIWNNKLDKFMEINFQKMGKINSDLFWGIPNYMLLYEGSNLQETRDDNGNRIWKAEMVFTFRTVTGDYTMGSACGEEGGLDGWNWVLREDSTMATTPWGKPYMSAAIPSKMFLYQATEFAPLLTAAGKPVTFPDLNWMA